MICKNKEKGKDQELIQSNNTLEDNILESDKNTRQYHIQGSQEVGPFSAGGHKAAGNRQDSMTDKHGTQIPKRTHKRSIFFERSVRNLLGGLNMLNGTNIILISDVDQAKQMFVLMKYPLLIDVSSPSKNKSRYKKI